MAEERTAPDRFQHPGLIHGAADIARVRRLVASGREPWGTAFERLATHPCSASDWKLRGPFALVVRDPAGHRHNREMEDDANAAYQNTLMWVLTGKEAHARKAVEILNAWAYKLERIAGHDAQLAAGLNGFQLVNAAELMRHTYDGWEARDVAQFETLLREVIYPPIKDFATFANGNWDAACICTMMASGVFCDDRRMFQRGVDYYYRGEGNGRITHYVVNHAGQCQESGRDQAHTQLGLGLLAEACEIGYRQGIDMYGAADNRLLHGFEYTARYLLGDEVPFVEHTDTTGKYHHTRISPLGRDGRRPIFEMPLNHYHYRLGLETPDLSRLAAQNRPDGPAHGADHPGFSTLMFYQERDTQ